MVKLTLAPFGTSLRSLGESLRRGAAWPTPTAANLGEVSFPPYVVPRLAERDAVFLVGPAAGVQRAPGDAAMHGWAALQRNRDPIESSDPIRSPLADTFDRLDQATLEAQTRAARRGDDASFTLDGNAVGFLVNARRAAPSQFDELLASWLTPVLDAARGETTVSLNPTFDAAEALRALGAGEPFTNLRPTAEPFVQRPQGRRLDDALRFPTQLPLQWRLNSPNAPNQRLDRLDKLAQHAQAAARAQGREVSFTAWPDVVSLVEQLATEAPRQVEAALAAWLTPKLQAADGATHVQVNPAFGAEQRSAAIASLLLGGDPVALEAKYQPFVTRSHK